MDGLDYDTCAQFLARLDADAENPLSAGAPSSTSSLSPADRTSLSPPGFSSATSLSSQPFSFNYNDSINQLWTDFSTPYNDISSPYFTGTWGSFMQPQGQQQVQSQQKQRDVVSPGMSDYSIKTEENTQGYFNGQPMTISPRNSLLDPNVQTAYEGSDFPYMEDGSSDPFSFNGNGNGFEQQRQQHKQPDSTWRNSVVMKDDFTPINWQQQQQQQQQPQPQQQQQQQQQLQQQQLQQQQQQQQLQQQQQQARLQQQQHQRQQASQETSMFRSISSPHSSSSPESNHHDSLDEAVPQSKKRKTSDSPEPGQSPPSHNHTSTSRKQQPKKTAHNMIEKRYRTNLNDKIAALRDSVPSLRVMAGTSKLGDDDEEEDLEGLTPAHKLNKATVLAKATEYIRHLEKRSKKLQEENEHLKNRLSAFEKLAAMGGAMAGPGRTASTGPGGGLMSRLMVGSLAGLMVANGLQEQDGNSRGLFAFPIPFTMPFDIGVTQSAVSSHYSFLLVLKALLFFTAVLYVFSPGFFDSRPRKAKTVPVHPVLSAVPSLASPVEVRRRAWLTAIQTVSVPHSFWLELAALGLKFMKLGIRQCVGWDGYSWLTGMTVEQEAARVKAWTIALDAQLAGGDQHVSHARLLLSLLASFTLPATPSRLMLNALHIRVFFWDLHFRFFFWDLHLGCEALAKRLSAYYWSEARKLQKAPAQANSEPLPEHLVRLLELEPSNVLSDRITQRAYNLCYNRPTEFNDTEEYHDEGMNAVVEDQAIRSPLDAVGAWYSSLILHRAFLASLRGRSKESDVTRMEADLDISMKTAPPISGAQLRVLASRAVLMCSAEGKDLQVLLKIFKDDFAAAERAPMEETGPQQNRMVTVTPDIKVALRCAMALTMIKQGSEKGRLGGMRLFSDFDWSMGQQDNFSAISKATNGEGTSNARSASDTPVPLPPPVKKPTILASKLGLLGFVVSWKTLTVIVSDRALSLELRESVEMAAGALRRWSGHAVAEQAGVGRPVRMKLGNFCTRLATRMAGMEQVEGGEGNGDAGYVSG